MKKIYFIVFSILVALTTDAQCVTESYIVDSDGYVNVRSDANSKAGIVTRLNSGTTVFYEFNNNSNWYRISLEKAGTPLGYIHYSRLAPAISTDSTTDGSALNIVMKEPGNILKYLPMDKLLDITSLTVSGRMYETDIAIIKMCIHLQYLNMENATISESPEGQERRKNALFKKDYEYEYPHMPDCFIPEEAFTGMKLKEVVLPKTVKLILPRAFYDCTSLQKVNLGESLMIIERSAFANTSLLEIKFPKTLKKIKGEAFDKIATLRVLDLSICTMTERKIGIGGLEVNADIGCLPNLESFYMPQGMTDFNPFVKTACSSLKDVYVGKNVNMISAISLYGMKLHFQSEIAPEIGFLGKVANCTIYVPKNGNITSYYAVFNNNGNKIVQK